MPVTQNKPGPYAPSTAVLTVVDRFRDRGLPAPITLEVLARAGVPESLVPRTHHTLQTLDLIDSKGAPTAVFEAIRLAPEAEYQARLAEWLTNAYADILAYIDPATADEGALHDAFRSYNPSGQRGRMVTLFIGLFRAAGIMPNKGPGGPPKKKTAIAKPVTRAAVGSKAKGNGGGGAGGSGGHIPPLTFDGALPPAIAGLLASLPTSGQGWTQAQRDAFMTTLGVVVDFCFPPGVVAKPEISVEDADALDA